MIKRIFSSYAAALVLVLSASAISFAQTSPGNIQNVKIENFGQMDEHYYRGAQPKKEDYQALAALGVKTIIDLQESPTKYEKSAAEALGMKYINIPMSSHEYPKPETIGAFLKEINDPANGTMYVHCKGGRHRTGVTAAAYRMTKYGWDYDKAYQEMLNYDFYTSGGYGKMKDFVVDYAAKLKTQPSKSVVNNTATSVNH